MVFQNQWLKLDDIHGVTHCKHLYQKDVHLHRRGSIYWQILNIKKDKVIYCYFFFKVPLYRNLVSHTLSTCQQLCLYSGVSAANPYLYNLISSQLRTLEFPVCNFFAKHFGRVMFDIQKLNIMTAILMKYQKLKFLAKIDAVLPMWTYLFTYLFYFGFPASKRKLCQLVKRKLYSVYGQWPVNTDLCNPRHWMSVLRCKCS